MLNLIPKPANVREQKNMLLLMILQLLKDSTDMEHPIRKEELNRRIEQEYGFLPARNTLYAKLDTLIAAGFPIYETKNGVYYDGCDLSDGQLRFLIDSVLYSSFTTQRGAAEILEALLQLGSAAFQKNMRKQISRLFKVRKNADDNVFMVLEDVQDAIFRSRQIRFNYVTYNEKLEKEHIYPEALTVNPYELVFKNGKYFLLGAMAGSDKMLSWRVDRLCEVEVLNSKCQEIPLMKEIRASGGMGKYIDAQPDLCGGIVETFKLQCLREAIDDIVDAFGQDFSIAPEQSDNYDPDTVVVAVRTTRESMKTWAFSHAGTVVVISPADFRSEMKEALRKAERQYTVAGVPFMKRIHNMESFEEALRLTKGAARKKLSYWGHSKDRTREKPEKIDVSRLVEISDLQALSLLGCDTGDCIFTKDLPMLTSLTLPMSRVNPQNLRYTPNLTYLSVSYMDDSVIPYLREMHGLRRLYLTRCTITDISFLSEMPGLQEIDFTESTQIKDYSSLTALPELRYLYMRFDERAIDFSFLKSLSSLKTLEIDSPAFTVELALELQKVLPDCMIRSKYYKTPEKERIPREKPKGTRKP